jgi:hypothetical protein
MLNEVLLLSDLPTLKKQRGEEALNVWQMQEARYFAPNGTSGEPVASPHSKNIHHRRARLKMICAVGNLALTDPTK